MEWAQARAGLAAADAVWAKARAKAPEEVPPAKAEVVPAGDQVPVSVNLEALQPGIYVRRASIDLPVKTTLIKATPEVFTVTILPLTGDKSQPETN